MPSEREIVQQLQQHVGTLVQSVADAAAWGDEWVRRATVHHQEQVSAMRERREQAIAESLSKNESILTHAHAEHRRVMTKNTSQYQQVLTDAEMKYTNATADVDAMADNIQHSADLLATDWDDERWSSWKPTIEREIPRALRIGTFTERGHENNSKIWPMLLPLLTGKSLLFEADTASRPGAIAAMQSISMRLLASIPPKRLLFTFLDPDNLGQNSAPFMALRESDPELVTRDTWTTERDINEQLEALQKHITFVNGLLGDSTSTIEQYNKRPGAIPQPYRLLVAFDFPESSLAHIEKIAETGPRSGVYAIILRNTETKPKASDFSLDKLRQYCLRLVARGPHLFWENDGDFRDCAIVPDRLPESRVYERMVRAVGDAAKNVKGITLPFEDVAPSPEDYWKQVADTELRVPLGIYRGVSRELALDEGDTPHALVIGRTGSGKTTLFHTLITGIALRYHPDDVHLYLMDLKQGVGFKVYTAGEDKQPRILPHARVIAIESEREYAFSVLERLDKELAQRGALFRAAGVEKLMIYREKTGIQMPRILLLIDEFQQLFVGDDQIAGRSSDILTQLAKQGRAYGIHIMLGSQTLRGTYRLPDDAISQIAVRIALQCNADDARYIFGDDNLEPQMLSQRGEAIYRDC